MASQSAIEAHSTAFKTFADYSDQIRKKFAEFDKSNDEIKRQMIPSLETICMQFTDAGKDAADKLAVVRNSVSHSKKLFFAYYQTPGDYSQRLDSIKKN